MAGQPSASPPVLVVDDDPAVRTHLAEILRRRGYATLEAATGEEALELAGGSTTPALVVLDICLPGISGYEVCHALRERFGQDLPIIFVSAARTESYDRVAGLLVGGDEYFAKPVPPDELLIRVDRLVGRRKTLAPVVAARLTGREREILGLLAQGLKPVEIAERLVLSPKTVGTHIEHIFTKLGVRTRAAAVAAAFRGEMVGSNV